MPSVAMGLMARAASADEVAAAAQYFAAQRLPLRVQVLERRQVPKLQVAGWLYAPAGGGTEVLGERLLEVAPDLERHERRDATLVYTAYVPPGSLRRGGALARTGTGKAVAPCTSCHGPELRGLGLIPPLAGRSPSYLLRQLYAFRSGARAAPAGEPMRAVAAALDPRDLIAAAAYAASLPP
jgi:cytochrome c553